MTSEVSKKLYILMAKEMGPMGAFIVKKQCDNLGLDPEELTLDQIPKLLDPIYNAIFVFTGKEKGKRIQGQIKRLGADMAQ